MEGSSDKRESRRPWLRPLGHRLWRGLKWLGSLIWAAIGDYQKHNVNRLAASIAFYAILSLAPLGVILVTVGGFAFGRRAAEGLIHEQLSDTVGETAARAIQDVINSASTSSASVPATIVAVLVLLFSASRLIGDMRGALNTIWEVQGHGGGGFKGFLIGKLIDIAMIIGLAVLLLATLGGNTAVNAITHYFESILPFPSWLLQAIGIAFSLTVAIIVLAVIFRFLPNIALAWKDVFLGALLSGIFFTIGNYFLAFYLARTSPGSVFGAAGSLVVIMIWIYYSAIIVLFGVELTKANRERRLARK